MPFQKKGIPEESELVLCTVTKIYPHAVFLSIDEYENVSGMAHISEISPGRIRNINEFVKLGKKVICKVLKIDREKGHIDLSLRRVSEGQRREKAESLKQEQLAEKFVELVAKETKQDLQALRASLYKQLPKEYSSLYDFFEEYTTNEALFTSLQLPAGVKEKLGALIKSRIKPVRVEAKGTLELTTYAPAGVEDIKSAIGAGRAQSDTVHISYLGAGKYSLAVSGDDHKATESLLNSVAQAIISKMNTLQGTATFKMNA